MARTFRIGTAAAVLAAAVLAAAVAGSPVSGWAAGARPSVAGATRAARVHLAAGRLASHAPGTRLWAATGRHLWTGSYSGAGSLGVCSLAVSPDGTKVFTGCTVVRSQAQYLTLGYDAANGTQLWQATYQLGRFPSTFSAIAATGSQVFVTGTANGHIGTVGYQADTGSQQWAARYPTPGGTSASGFSIAVSPDGSVVYAAGAANESYATVAYDTATGSRLWGQQWFGDAGGTASSVAASPAGDRVFVTGVTTLPAGDGSFSAGYGTVAYRS